ncbi:hypothetical protein VTI74DRAFT_10822 [Chaetomium olivicolor]
MGDILYLQSGGVVPADGVLMSGYGIRADEYLMTGESEQVEKVAAGKVLERLVTGKRGEHLGPFITSGSKILKGIGTCLVTGTGVNNLEGRLRMSLGERTEATPLQRKPSVVTNRMAMAGIAVAGLLFFVLTIKFLVRLPASDRSPLDQAQVFLLMFIISITIVVLAMPEGLPLATTLALAIAVV